jgi:hypothetical protein
MELRAFSAALQQMWDSSSLTFNEEQGMAFPGKREGLAQKVDTAAKEAERLGLTTATLILRMARLEIDRAEPDEVESMPRNNWRGKPN